MVGSLRRKASTVAPRDSSPPPRSQPRISTSRALALVPEEAEAPDIAEIMQEQLQQFASQLDALREENIQLKRQMGEDRDRNAAQLAVVSDRVKALEAQLQKAEVSRRAENMVIHGLEEQDGVTAAVAVARACRDVGLPESSWRDAFRLGRERRGPDSRPRPILVKFDSKEAKHRVFSRSKALRDHQVYLDDDLTAEQQATRRSLAGEYQKLKMAKLKPFYRQERLLYVHRGRVVQHQVGMALPSGSQASQGPLQNRAPARQPAPAPAPCPPQQASRLPSPPFRRAAAQLAAQGPPQAAGQTPAQATTGQTPAQAAAGQPPAQATAGQMTIARALTAIPDTASQTAAATTPAAPRP